MKTKKAPPATLNLYLILGSVFLSIFLHRIYLRYRPIKLEQVNSQPSALNSDSPLVTDTPFIQFDSLRLKLPIFPATLRGSHWETTTKGISYLSTSSLPGSGGNSVLYGHNYPNLLGNLKNIKPGDEVQVTMNHTLTRYRVTYTMVVPPSDTSVFQPTRDNRLTIYTCIGPFDRDRLIVVAHPL